jgi:hypothetical protein
MTRWFASESAVGTESPRRRQSTSGPTGGYFEGRGRLGAGVEPPLLVFSIEPSVSSTA